ncbi:MAG: 4Fe-4S dicluster domain-containing protein [Pseudomonadota bacterium]
MKLVYVDLDRCLGCLSCERICFIRQAGLHLDEAPNIWVRVDLDRRLISTSTCRQCDTPLCLAACPAGALERDPATGAVVVNRDLCLGCGVCVTACPSGAIRLETNGRAATKCDLCGGDPQCVQVCMAQALHFGDIEELIQKKRDKAGLNLMARAVDKGPAEEK